MKKTVTRLSGLLLFVFAASVISDDISSHLPSGCIHSGVYYQEKTLEGMAKPLQTRGDYIFHCEQGLIWHTASPVTETAIYRVAGDHWLLDADGSTARLDSRLHKSLGNLLNRLVGGDAEWLQRNFDAETDSTGLGLRPKQRGMRRAIERIHIRREPPLATIVMWHTDGEVTRIAISDIRTQESLDSTQCEAARPGQKMACYLLFQ